MQVLTIARRQAQGRYADVLDYLAREKRTTGKLATLLAAEAIRSSREYKIWKRTKGKR